MARGVNKVILVGNLGADPDARYMPSGGAVTTISVATSERWTDKNTNEPQERTEWHRVTLFNRLGEIAAEYLRKGSQVYIEGSIRTDKYQDKQTGQDRYSTQIIARDMQLLGGRPDSAGGSGGGSRDEFERTQGARPARAVAEPRPAAAKPASPAPAMATASAGADFDDDIPFARSELERLV